MVLTPAPPRLPGPALALPDPGPDLDLTDLLADLVSRFPDPGVPGPALNPRPAVPPAGPSPPGSDPQPPLPGTTAEPVDITTWYARTRRRRRHRRLAVVIVITTALTWAVINGPRLTQPPPASAVPPRSHPAASPPHSVIYQARARQRRRHQRMAQAAADTGGAAGSWAAARGSLPPGRPGAQPRHHHAPHAQTTHHSKPPPAGAAGYAPITGSGSSWAPIAIDQWSIDLRSLDPRADRIEVNYNPDGSAAGRADFVVGVDDFAASDVPFRDGHDKLARTSPEVVASGYSYLPLAATGIAFAYNLPVHGHLITNLRLSGTTLMKIFTGQITNWDNPHITRDYGHRLPSLPITPVIDSDGSSPTYFLTRWLASVFPRQWNAFCAKVTHGRVSSDCGPTEFFPVFGRAAAENGSGNVMAYITSSWAKGAIGYAEYAYALNAHWPVLQLRNPAGKYVRPLPADVTTALTQATVNDNPHSPGFGEENLTPLYTYKNSSNYPLSYYGYLIAPGAGHRPQSFTKAKGRTLSKFLAFALCQGQRQLPQLGYAPLSPSLVKSGLTLLASIPGHGPLPSASQCVKQS